MTSEQSELLRTLQQDSFSYPILAYETTPDGEVFIAVDEGIFALNWVTLLG